MKEVVKCSISGVAFTMEASAYRKLSDYLETLKRAYRNSAEGREIVEDIEARIAELILSRQSNARVVEEELVEWIIAQMGSAEAISDRPGETGSGEERMPRRLYRDMERARLGGVCAGVAKYFDVGPVLVRLLILLPLLCLLLSWVPVLGWMASLMGNLFGVFVVCYLIMWFAVPVARTPRQKLEQNGARITLESIEQTAMRQRDVDADVKSIVAKAIFALGQVVLIAFKILGGFLVFAFIMVACALIVSLFAVGIVGPDFISSQISGWTASLGIISVLLPVLLLVYVLMCVIASRRPSVRTVVVTFVVWLLFVVGTSVMAVWETSELRREHRMPDPDMVLPAMEPPVGEPAAEAEGAGFDMSVSEQGMELSVVDREGESFRMQADREGLILTSGNEPGAVSGTETLRGAETD